MPDKKIVVGFVAGVMATLTVPWAVQVTAPLVRPAGKALLKQALYVFEIVRERLAVAGEGLADLIAEARAEVDGDLARRGPPRRHGRAVAAGPASPSDSTDGPTTSRGSS